MASSHAKPSSRYLQDDAFGHWLSGMTDGEGCFFCVVKDYRHRNRAAIARILRYGMCLRADDAPILREIQEYFGCGFIKTKRRFKTGRANPVDLFQIYSVVDLAEIVIPHFEKYPLRAKKQRDYLIWREAVLLAQRVSRRPYRGRGYARGREMQWTPEEDRQLRQYADDIHRVRQFDETRCRSDRSRRLGPPQSGDGLTNIDHDSALLAESSQQPRDLASRGFVSDRNQRTLWGLGDDC